IRIANQSNGPSGPPLGQLRRQAQDPAAQDEDKSSNTSNNSGELRVISSASHRCGLFDFPKTESTLFSSRNNGLWRSTSIPRTHMRGESSRKGQPGLNSREAAEFRYLLAQRKIGA